MAGRSLRPRLQDILDNISIVRGAIEGRDFASFASDPVLRLAIERATHLSDLRPVIEAILSNQQP